MYIHPWTEATLECVLNHDIVILNLVLFIQRLKVTVVTPSGGFMNRFWKVAALVALVAVPLILMGKKKPIEKEFIPESGDSSDIFDGELRAD